MSKRGRSTAEQSYLQLAVKQGFITAEQLAEARREAAGSDSAVLEVLRDGGRITPEQIEFLAKNAERIERKIAGYKVTGRLGKGGMGWVYRAIREADGREVAIKVLSPALAGKPEIVKRFTREARLVGELSHENIAAGLEVGEFKGLHYFVMEYVDGESLDVRIARAGALPEAEALGIARQVALALDYAYRKNGLVHRDIKPDNVLLQGERVKLLDLGVARTAGGETKLTHAGEILGTPLYMSPEQARTQGDVDIRSDVYSLGATLYQMLTGEPPFTAESPLVVMAKHCNEKLVLPIERNPELSVAVTRLVARMLAKPRALRHATPGEVVADIDRVLQGAEIELAHPIERYIDPRAAPAAEAPALELAPDEAAIPRPDIAPRPAAPPAPAPAGPSWARQNRVLLAVAGIWLVLAVGYLGYKAFSGGEPERKSVARTDAPRPKPRPAARPKQQPAGPSAMQQSSKIAGSPAAPAARPRRAERWAVEQQRRATGESAGRQQYVATVMQERVASRRRELLGQFDTVDAAAIRLRALAGQLDREYPIALSYQNPASATRQALAQWDTFVADFRKTLGQAHALSGKGQHYEASKLLDGLTIDSFTAVGVTLDAALEQTRQALAHNRELREKGQQFYQAFRQKLLAALKDPGRKLERLIAACRNAERTHRTVAHLVAREREDLELMQGFGALLVRAGPLALGKRITWRGRSWTVIRPDPKQPERLMMEDRRGIKVGFKPALWALADQLELARLAAGRCAAGAARDRAHLATFLVLLFSQLNDRFREALRELEQVSATDRTRYRQLHDDLLDAAQARARLLTEQAAATAYRKALALLARDKFAECRRLLVEFQQRHGRTAFAARQEQDTNRQFEALEEPLARARGGELYREIVALARRIFPRDYWADAQGRYVYPKPTGDHKDLDALLRRHTLAGRILRVEFERTLGNLFQVYYPFDEQAERVDWFPRVSPHFEIAGGRLLARGAPKRDLIWKMPVERYLDLHAVVRHEKPNSRLLLGLFVRGTYQGLYSATAAPGAGSSELSGVRSKTGLYRDYWHRAKKALVEVDGPKLPAGQPVALRLRKVGAELKLYLAGKLVYRAAIDDRQRGLIMLWAPGGGLALDELRVTALVPQSWILQQAAYHFEQDARDWKKSVPTLVHKGNFGKKRGKALDPDKAETPNVSEKDKQRASQDGRAQKHKDQAQKGGGKGQKTGGNPPPKQDPPPKGGGKSKGPGDKPGDPVKDGGGKVKDTGGKVKDEGGKAGEKAKGEAKKAAGQAKQEAKQETKKAKKAAKDTSKSAADEAKKKGLDTSNVANLLKGLK